MQQKYWCRIDLPDDVTQIRAGTRGFSEMVPRIISISGNLFFAGVGRVLRAADGGGIWFPMFLPPSFHCTRLRFAPQHFPMACDCAVLWVCLGTMKYLWRLCAHDVRELFCSTTVFFLGDGTFTRKYDIKRLTIICSFFLYGPIN